MFERQLAVVGAVPAAQCDHRHQRLPAAPDLPPHPDAAQQPAPTPCYRRHRVQEDEQPESPQ